MGLGLQTYHDTYKTFPFGSRAGRYISHSMNSMRTGPNWKASILPLLEEGSLYNMLDFKFGMFGEPWTNNEILENLVVSTRLFQPVAGGLANASRNVRIINRK